MTGQWVLNRDRQMRPIAPWFICRRRGRLR